MVARLPILSLLLCPALVLADGGGSCEDLGGRRVLPVEAAELLRLQAEVVSRLPPAPAGWTRSPLPRRDAATACWMPGRGVPLSWNVSYQEAGNQLARLQAFEAGQLEALLAYQAEAGAVQEAMNQVAEAIGKAAEAGDSERIDELSRQMQELTAPLDARSAALEASQRRARALAFRDTKASLQLEVNGHPDQWVDGLIELPWPGAQRAGELPGPDGGFENQTVLMAFLGAWERYDDESGQRMGAPGEGPGRDGLRVLIRIEAAPERGRQMLAALDTGTLVERLRVAQVATPGP